MDAVRVTIFLHKELLKRVKKRMDAEGFTSLQEYIRYLLREDLKHGSDRLGD